MVREREKHNDAKMYVGLGLLLKTRLNCNYESKRRRPKTPLFFVQSHEELASKAMVNGHFPSAIVFQINPCFLMVTYISVPTVFFF